MSTLTARETATALATLPRVNLLPPEIERGAAVPQGAGSASVPASVAALGVVGGLVLAGRSSRSATPRSELDDGQGRSATRCRPSRPSTPTSRPSTPRWTPPRRSSSQAMGKEIRWSYFLNDLSLTHARARCG